MLVGFRVKLAIGSWARYIGLGTLGTGNPGRQGHLLGLGTLADAGGDGRSWGAGAIARVRYPG